MQTKKIERDRLGNPILDCEICGTKLVRKSLIIKPWGHTKKVIRPYCPKCKKYRNGKYRYKVVNWSFTKMSNESV